MDGHGYAVVSEIGAILLALGILGRFAGRLRVSPIPLYLLGGLAFGHGGVLELSASTEFISTGAQIGVLLLLLTLGLEYSAEQLVSGLRSNAGAGVLDLVLGGAPGAVCGLVLGWGLAGSLGLAGVTAVSSSGIISKLIADLGRGASPETPVVISILVLEDLAMAVYLPVLTAVLSHAGAARSVVTVAIAVTTVAAVLLAATRWSHLLSRVVSYPMDVDKPVDNEVLLLRVLGITLLVAGLAEQLAGLSRGRRVPGGHRAHRPGRRSGAQGAGSAARSVRRRVLRLLRAGDRSDRAYRPCCSPRRSSRSFLPRGKVATGWWAARRRGLSITGRMRAGATLIAHGEFSIVIAGLAVASGQPAKLGALAACYVLLLADRRPARRPVRPTRLARRLSAAAETSGHATGSVHR